MPNPFNIPQIPQQMSSPGLNNIPQIPQLSFGGQPGLQSNFQIPSLGSLIQPPQPGQGFDLMAALQQGNQQILGARELANKRPVLPPKPVTPAPTTTGTRTGSSALTKRVRDGLGWKESSR